MASPAPKAAAPVSRVPTAPPAPTPMPARRSSSPRAAGSPVLRLVSLRSTIPATAPADIRAVLARDAGAPLGGAVREPLEQSLGVDLGAVRVHQGGEATALVADRKARALAFGTHVFLGPGQRSADLGLIAHEVAHVVQQQGGPRVQAYASQAATDALEHEAHHISAAVVRGEPAQVALRSAPRPQYSLGDWVKSGIAAVGEFVGDIAGMALDFIKDRARVIPGYDMLGFILGRDPITQKPVARNAVNLIKAVMGLWPAGSMIFDALQSNGIIDKVGAWLEQQLATLVAIVGGIKSALDRFIKTLGPKDALDLSGAWNRAKKIFSEPIDQATTFVKGLAIQVLTFIRDAILLPVAKLAEGTRGYDLLKAVLGKNPITGEPVPQDAATLIGGFMKLIGEEEIWQRMQKANAIPRAFAWFKTAMAEMKAFVAEIPPTFIRALKSLEVVDMILIPKAFAKLAMAFGDFIGRFISWAGGTIWKLLEIIFEVVSPGALEYIKKTGAALKSILKDPMPFVKNLVKAAKLGFENFSDNIWEHLKKGLIDWLLGALPGVYIPKAFQLGEIVKFVFSVLGLTWQNLRAKLVDVLGETVVKAMETGFKIVVTLVREGPAAAWEEVKSELSNLKDQIIDGIIGMVVDTIVKKAVPKLIAMFIPGAGFISAILSIYETVMVFVNKIAKIIQVVKAFIDSIISIASGVIDAAAKKVESILSGLLSLAISFLAGFLGLGNVADKIMDVIKKVRAVIDKALDAMIKWIVKMAKSLFASAKAGVKKLVEWWKKKKKFTVDGEPHELSFRGEKKSAALMVASDPVQLDKFLTDKAKTAKGDAKTAIGVISKLLTKLKTEMAKDEAKQDAKEINDLFDKISEQLPSLLSGDDWGSKLNPVLLPEYPKPRLSSYAPIYLGPKANDYISQDKFEELYGRPKTIANQTAKEVFGNKVKQADWEAVDKKITKFIPTKQEPLPGGGERIGVAAHNQVQVGLTFEYTPGKTAGGRKLNSLLRPYGFRPGKDSMDADHVVEIQLVGKTQGDQVNNLWPLDYQINRHGRSLSEENVEIPEEPKKTMKLGAAKTKKKKGPLFVMLKQTK